MTSNPLENLAKTDVSSVYIPTCFKCQVSYVVKCSVVANSAAASQLLSNKIENCVSGKIKFTKENFLHACYYTYSFFRFPSHYLYEHRTSLLKKYLHSYVNTYYLLTQAPTFSKEHDY